MLPRELMAQGLADGVDIASPEHRVRPGEVDVLEHALQPLRRLEGLEGRAALVAHDQDLSRLDVSDHPGLHEIERASLGGQDPGIAQLSERKWAEARGIADADHALGRQQQERERSLDAGQRPRELLDQRRAGLTGQQMENDLGVGVGLKDRPVLFQLGTQLLRIDQVAVVGDGHRAVRGIGRDRLGIAQARGAGGGVAHMPDGTMAGEALETLAAEGVGHPAHGLLHLKGPAVGRGDAGRFLSAVLQRIEPEIDDVGGLGVVPHAEQPALVVELVVELEGRSLSRHVAQSRSSTLGQPGPATG